jgi:hypothetical protein
VIGREDRKGGGLHGTRGTPSGMAAKSSPKSTKRTTKRPPAAAAETTTTAETANVESMSTGATATTSLRTPSHDEIARRAYELFLARGRQHGRAHEDWMTAERELRARYSVN